MRDRLLHAGTRRTPRVSRSPCLAACLCVAAGLAACDETFDPIAPSTVAFSVFGYLDASADTQWIRVMPLRSLRVASRDSLAARVTLEHLESGRVIELRDSLFRFRRSWDPEVGSEGTYVHNLWTPEPLEPGAAYRFSAVREGKEPAEAVVELPRDYAVEVGIRQSPAYWPADELRITGVKHLPFVTTITHFHDLCGSAAVRGGYLRSAAEEGTHRLVIGKPQGVAVRDGCGRAVVDRWELWIVGSETAWPTGGYSPDALGESGQTSNVTHAVGFLAGVLTKLLPYEDCEFPRTGTAVPAYCWLRYDGETASLTGTVTETGGCGTRPIGAVTVQLKELDRDPARIRTVVGNGDGEFLIGALEPGVPHSLLVRTPPILVDGELTDMYSAHTDTVTFVPGQELRYDIKLERLTPCGVPSSAVP